MFTLISVTVRANETLDNPCLHIKPKSHKISVSDTPSIFMNLNKIFVLASVPTNVEENVFQTDIISSIAKCSIQENSRAINGKKIADTNIIIFPIDKEPLNFLELNKKGNLLVWLKLKKIRASSYRADFPDLISVQTIFYRHDQPLESLYGACSEAFATSSDQNFKFLSRAIEQCIYNEFAFSIKK
jgi:hypothetical protein